MRTLKCTVRLAGKLDQTVPNKIVTIPEIAVLRAVHGDDALVDIVPLPKEQWARTQHDGFDRSWPRTNGEEVERLKGIYGDELMAKLFGPVAPRLPTRLRDISIDPVQLAANLEAEAKRAAAAAAAYSEALDGGEEDDEEGELDDLLGDPPAATAPAQATA